MDRHPVLEPSRRIFGTFIMRPKPNRDRIAAGLPERRSALIRNQDAVGLEYSSACIYPVFSGLVNTSTGTITPLNKCRQSGDLLQ